MCRDRGFCINFWFSALRQINTLYRDQKTAKQIVDVIDSQFIFDSLFVSFRFVCFVCDLFPFVQSFIRSIISPLSRRTCISSQTQLHLSITAYLLYICCLNLLCACRTIPYLLRADYFSSRGSGRHAHQQDNTANSYMLYHGSSHFDVIFVEYCFVH